VTKTIQKNIRIKENILENLELISKKQSEDSLNQRVQSLTNKEFQKLLEILTILFNENYFDKKSNNYTKALYTFEEMKNRGWDREKFLLITWNFFINHRLNYWNPVHILEFDREDFEKYQSNDKDLLSEEWLKRAYEEK